MGEFELIKKYFQEHSQGDGVVVGIGDDCALLQVSEGYSLAVSVDTLVADVHFPSNGDPEKIAERALRVNLSDLAAVGARPRWFTLAISLPSVDENWLKSFSQGLLRVATQYQCVLVGGDTTKGPLSISIQVHGEVIAERALLRGGARVGDLIYVTGDLGAAAAAVLALESKVSPTSEDRDYLMSRYYKPTPRLAEAKLLAPFVSAAIDVSDGLVADLGHICEQSNVAALLDLDRLPVAEAVRRSVKDSVAVELAAAGGDDYELCLTVRDVQRSQFESVAKRHGIKVTLIGNITSGTGVACLMHGAPHQLSKQGYQHF